ncbi:MAG: carbonic anhydrase, partial [Solirubrobacterales bacterium]
AKQPAKGRAPHPRSPRAALRALQGGNKRYRANKLELRDYSPVGERRASKQAPFAAIITCSDSRVSPTLIFDVERGNLFVSKVAGNSIDVGTLGSTEYAVAVLGVKLIIVLGHSDCGAVRSALGVANGTSSYPPSKYGAIGEIVGAIVPTVSAIPAGQRTLQASVAANARAQAAAIAATEPIIKPAVDEGRLWVRPAVYNIPNGRVRLL